MVVKSITRTYKKGTGDCLERTTLIERLRRVRALNASPSCIGITQYTWKTFAINEPSRKRKKK